MRKKRERAKIKGAGKITFDFTQPLTELCATIIKQSAVIFKAGQRTRDMPAHQGTIEKNGGSSRIHKGNIKRSEIDK
jgi:hypothetical protein